MRRKTSVRVLSLIAGLLFIALFTVAVIPDIRQATLRTLSQPESTPDNLIFLPFIQDNAEELSTPESLVDGAGLPPGWVDTDPNVQDVETEGTAEAFNTPIPYTPAPTPDLNATTIPELDRIEIVDLRSVDLPAEEHSSLGLITWSPDSKQFAGVKIGNDLLEINERGQALMDLYIGSAETGQLSLKQHNAGWPLWSRDGQSIYYLTTKVEQQSFRYDLSKLDISTGKITPVADNILVPVLPKPSVQEIGKDQLLTLNSQYLPAVFRLPDLLDKPIDLAEGNSPLLRPFVGPFTKDDRTAQMYPEYTDYALSTDQRSIAISTDGFIHIIDIQTGDVTATVKTGTSYTIPIRWTPDDSALAFVNSKGIFVYELVTATATQVMSPQTLGLVNDDYRSGVSQPMWSPDGKVILFVAISPEWLTKTGFVEPQFGSFLFAVTRDGKTWRAISNSTVVSMAPDDSSVVMEEWDSALGTYQKSVARISW